MNKSHKIETNKQKLKANSGAWTHDPLHSLCCLNHRATSTGSERGRSACPGCSSGWTSGRRARRRTAWRRCGPARDDAPWTSCRRPCRKGCKQSRRHPTAAVGRGHAGHWWFQAVAAAAQRRLGATGGGNQPRALLSLAAAAGTKRYFKKHTFLTNLAMNKSVTYFLEFLEFPASCRLFQAYAWSILTQIRIDSALLNM